MTTSPRIGVLTHRKPVWRKTTMTHCFTLDVSLPSGMDYDAWVEALFEAGCDDSSPGMVGDGAHIDFHRDAVSLEDAVRSACVQVRSIGCQVQRLELAREELQLWTV